MSAFDTTLGELMEVVVDELTNVTITITGLTGGTWDQTNLRWTGQTTSVTITVAAIRTARREQAQGAPGAPAVEVVTYTIDAAEAPTLSNTKGLKVTDGSVTRPVSKIDRPAGGKAIVLECRSDAKAT